MSHLASWLRRETLNAEAERMVDRAVREAGGVEAVPSRHTHVPGDPWRLRGIPVVGVHGGVGGAIPGTKPDNVRAFG